MKGAFAGFWTRWGSPSFISIALDAGVVQLYRTYPLLRAARKFNRPSETYETLEDYGDLWLKMFGASVVCGKNFGVHEWPLQKWRFIGARPSWRGGAGGLPPAPAFKLWRIIEGEVEIVWLARRTR